MFCRRCEADISTRIDDKKRKNHAILQAFHSAFVRVYELYIIVNWGRALGIRNYGRCSKQKNSNSHSHIHIFTPKSSVISFFEWNYAFFHVSLLYHFLFIFLSFLLKFFFLSLSDFSLFLVIICVKKCKIWLLM